MSLKETLGKEKNSYILELIVVIMLGITSVMGSLAAYQSGLNSSAMSKDYNEGIATITDANSFYVEAGQVLSRDQAIYMELVRLEYDWAFSEEGSAEEAKAEEVYSEYANKFISPELQEAIDWAAAEQESTGYYVSPFDHEPYIAAIYADADATYDAGRTLLEEGHMYNTYGDRMGLIVIYYATVLFLLGICGTLKQNTLKLGLVVFSAAVFVFATVQMCAIPFLSP